MGCRFLQIQVRIPWLKTQVFGFTVSGRRPETANRSCYKTAKLLPISFWYLWDTKIKLQNPHQKIKRNFDPQKRKRREINRDVLLTVSK